MMGSARALTMGLGLAPLMVALGTCIGPVAEAAPATGEAGAAAMGQRAAQAAAAAQQSASQAAAAPSITLDRATVAQGGATLGRISPANGQLTLDGAAVPVAADGRFI
ncbi:MAG: hypothetical protein ACKOUM_04800, partial [Sphingopyxis sp.]